MLEADEASLVEDLANIGLEVKSVYDLVNTCRELSGGDPVLLKHLRLPHHERIQEGILRALAVKEARGIATEPLLTEFKNTPSDSPGTIAGPKWLLANALAVAADDTVLNLIIFLIADKSPILEIPKGADDQDDPCPVLRIPDDPNSCVSPRLGSILGLAPRRSFHSSA